MSAFYHQFCDICEEPLDQDGFTTRARCDECVLGVKDLSERAAKVMGHLIRRIAKLEEKIEPPDPNDE